jgi:hypothetical protein
MKFWEAMHEAQEKRQVVKRLRKNGDMLCIHYTVSRLGGLFVGQITDKHGITTEIFNYIPKQEDMSAENWE